jgi:cytoskeletal protein RodZ
MGVSLAEVEVATRIRQKYLSALEADEWHLLPGEVVGRGFLRNYADYLGLDPDEAIERRRAISDQNLAAALAVTSAGAPLPPERRVDYRPKEVDLKDETDGIQPGEIRLTPILAILALALVVAGVWWGLTRFGDSLSDMATTVQATVTDLFEGTEPTPTAAIVGVVNEQNTTGTVDGVEPPAALTPAVVVIGSGGEATQAAATPATGAGTTPQEQPTPVAVPTSTPTEQPVEAPVEGGTGLSLALPTPTAADQAAAPVEPAAATPEAPTPEAPTPEPPPTATPELPTPEPPTPEPLPTDTPTPEPAPAPAAVACADLRSTLSGLGQGQVVSGVVGISGSATHENFQYYKLEYAPGTNAAGGFVYFDGSNSQISGGLLGNFDSRTLPNGEYTIRITVVDQSGNFPPPCAVSIVVQN